MTALQEKPATSKNTTELAASLASIVKRLGSPVSTILLDTPCQIFNLPHLEGVVGYKLFGNHAVVIGDPICLPQNLAELTQSFHLYCQKCNWKVIYFLASDSFAHWAINHGCHSLIQVGKELILDPAIFQKKQKVRWKINQSVQHGVVIKEYRDFDLLIEKEMQNTIDAWLKSKQGPQISLGQLDPFAKYDNKRIFYALQENKVVGIVGLSRIDQFQGWVVNSFLSLDGPVGVSEHLMSSVFDILASEDCHFLCLGAVSGTKLGEITGMSTLSKYLAHLIFRISRWFFNLDARQIYLNKYHPDFWPTYILTREKLSFNDLMAIKKTLNVKF